MTPELLADKTLLIIDDDPAIRESLELGLKEGSPGVTIFSAADAKEGMELAKAHHPHVIILDLKMPLGNGFDFVDALRADPTLKTTRILMLTANASSANEWESIDRDIDDFMAKPFDLIELEGRIKSLVTKPYGTARRI